MSRLDDVWIFGYGSLIWRIDFPHEEERMAYIKGWQRKFWQGSTDHRGLPGKPGRVATLINAPESICWGKAYRIHPEQLKDVLAHLDYREKGGYDRLELDIHFDEQQQVTGLTYHATHENENFLGHASSQEIAAQVKSSHGPSGSNQEYVLELHRALLQMGQQDDHLDEIVAALSSHQGSPIASA